MVAVSLLLGCSRVTAWPIASREQIERAASLCHPLISPDLVPVRPDLARLPPGGQVGRDAFRQLHDGVVGGACEGAAAGGASLGIEHCYLFVGGDGHQ